MPKKIRIAIVDETREIDHIDVTLPLVVLSREVYDRAQNSIALLLRRNGFKDDTPQIAGNCSNCRKLIWADEKYDYYPDDDMWYCMSCSGKGQKEGE